jgi:hypothetical protein
VTPEALVGAFALADRFGLMLMQMQGEPLPELPAHRGRVITAPPIPTPEQDAQQVDAEARAAAAWQALASDDEGASCD